MYHIVYQTTNLINGKIYVGKHSTENLNDGYLGSGLALEAAIKKYGRNNFKQVPLMLCETEDQAYRCEEAIVTQEFVRREDTYNEVIGGAGWKLGRLATEETKAKLSKMRAGKKRKPHSEETKRKIGERSKGRRHSDETKQKLSAMSKGFRHSEETKQRMSIIQKGKQKRKLTEEEKRKMSEARKGKAKSDAGRANIAASNKARIGYKWSDEQRQNIAAAKQASREKRLVTRETV